MPPSADERTLLINRPSGPAFAAGRVLPSRLGRYQILGEIAHGGMGAVLRARDPDLGRDLAVKVLLEAHADDLEAQQHFVEEARIAGQIQHPNIVPILELGWAADGRPFIAMKLVMGRTLAELLAARPDQTQGPGQELPRFLAVFEQVCQGVAYAHSRAVIHRDLKPANVMVGAFGEVQVMDWGLAQVLRETPDPPGEARTTLCPEASAEQSHPGLAQGTPDYMAPEQARGEVDLDRRCDVFGLGAILCQVLTGEPPFRTPLVERSLALSARGDLSVARAQLGQCGADPELVNLALDCLAPDRAGRPADAAAVAARITAHRAGVEVRLRRAELEQATASARRRAERRLRRVLAVLAGAAVLLAVAGGVRAWIGARAREQARAGVMQILDRAGILARQAEGIAGDASLRRLEEALAVASEARQAADHPLVDADLRNEARDVRARLELEVGALRRDRQLLAGLTEARAGRDDTLTTAGVDAGYLRAFRVYGLDLDGTPVAEAATRLRQRPPAVLRELVPFLDDWYQDRLRREQGNGDRPLALALALDEDAWRNAIRRSLRERARAVEPALLATGLSPGHGPAWTPLTGGLLLVLHREDLRRLARSASQADLEPDGTRLLSEALVRAGALAEGLKLLRQGVLLHPNDPGLNHDLAQILHRGPAPDLNQAIRYYSAARAGRPALGHALAHALWQRGDVGEAADLLQELIRLRPDVAAHHGCLGVLLAKDLGQRSEALKHLREAVRLAPERPDHQFDLACVLEQEGHQAEALIGFRRAASLDPQSSRATAETVRMLLALRRPDEAARILASLPPGTVDLAGWQLRIGRAWLQMGQTDEGIAALRKAVRAAPTNGAGWLELIRALDQAGRHAEAARAREEGPAAAPDDPVLCVVRGQRLVDTGRREEAISAYQRAIALEPDYGMAYYALGTTWLDLGRLPEAERALRRSAELQPDHAESHCNLGHVLSRQGKHRQALSSLRSGHELGTRRGSSWPYPSARWVEDAARLAALAEQPGGLPGQRP